MKQLSKIDIRINNAVLWHKETLGLKIDIENPVIFSEKIVWLYKNFFTKDGNKKSDWDRIYDKITFKDYINEHFGENHVAKLYGIYKTPFEIDFEKLPEIFILKSTRGSWGKEVETVNKLNSNRSSIREQAAEWVNKPGSAKIMAEQYIPGANTDYKFYMSAGKCLFISAETKSDIKNSRDCKVSVLFDTSWKQQPFQFFGEPNNNTVTIQPPKGLNKMLSLAAKASLSFPFLRVDFFESDNGDIYFSEFCGFPHEGKIFFAPEYWNKAIGELIDLSAQR